MRKFNRVICITLLATTVAGFLAMAEATTQNLATPSELSISDATASEAIENTLASDSNSIENEDSIVLNTFENTPSYNGKVSFVMDGGIKEVKFTSGDESIGHTDADGNAANSSDTGGGYSKAYFIAWSNIPNYTGTKEQLEAGAKAFYTEEPISNAFPNGLDENSKLYPAYLSSASAILLSSRLTGDIAINRHLSNEEIMYNQFDIKDANESTRSNDVTYYMSNDLSEDVKVNLGANFIMNPFIQAIARYSLDHYFQPGTAQWYGNHEYENMTSTSKDVNVTKYTFIDLHVKIDDRIKINNEIKFAFDSYSFRPLMILDKDYNKIENANIETPTGTKRSTISFDSNNSSEFIIRTVLRKKTDVPAASFEEANNFNMELVSLSENTFTVKKEELDKIARGKANPLSISGDISGGAHLYGYTIFGFTIGGPTNIPKVEARAINLNYKYNLVSFDKNSANLGDTSTQDLGKSYVIHNKGLSIDSLNNGEAPSTAMATYGDSMALSPSDIIKDGIRYKFKEWNTQADGNGTSFDGNTIVSEDITVYAIYTASIYKVHYNFVSADTSKSLPNEILSRLPQDENDKPEGTLVTPNENFDKTELKVSGGKWIWLNWDPRQIQIQDRDVTFTGLWKFEEEIEPSKPSTPSEPTKPNEPSKPNEPTKSTEETKPSIPETRPSSPSNGGNTPSRIIIHRESTTVTETMEQKPTESLAETEKNENETIIPNKNERNKSIPITGDTNSILIYFIGMGFAISLMGYLGIRRK